MKFLDPMKYQNTFEIKKVAVVIPSYNRLGFLERLLDCLLKQTYNDFEVFIVDASDENIEKVISKYSRIPYFHFLLSEHKSITIQRNMGVKTALSREIFDYITFIDSDDYVIDTYLEDLVFLIGNDADVLFTLPFISYSPNDLLLKRGMEKPNKRIVGGIEAINMFLNGNASAAAWGKLYKASILKKHLFDESLVINEDYEFNFRALLDVDHVSISDYRGYCFYRKGESMTRRKNLTNEQLFGCIYANYIMLKKSLLYKDIKDACEQLYADNVLGFFPLFNFKKVSRSFKKKVYSILSSEISNDAIVAYKPYNKQGVIKKRCFLLNKHLYKLLFDIRLLIKGGKYSIADK